MRKKRRRKWKAPNNPTPQAKQLYKFIYHEPWPKGWTVGWAGFMRGASGLTDYNTKRILLSWGDCNAKKHRDPARAARETAQRQLEALGVAYAYRFTDEQKEADWWSAYAGRLRRYAQRHTLIPDGAISIMVHEFVHVRHGHKLNHGADFDRFVLQAERRLLGIKREEAI